MERSRLEFEEAIGELAFRCLICEQDMLLPVRTPCKHRFCHQCVVRYISKLKQCPICSTPISHRDCLTDYTTGFQERYLAYMKQKYPMASTESAEEFHDAAQGTENLDLFNDPDMANQDDPIPDILQEELSQVPDNEDPLPNPPEIVQRVHTSKVVLEQLIDDLSDTSEEEFDQDDIGHEMEPLPEIKQENHVQNSDFEDSIDFSEIQQEDISQVPFFQLDFPDEDDDSQIDYQPSQEESEGQSSDEEMEGNFSDETGVICRLPRAGCYEPKDENDNTFFRSETTNIDGEQTVEDSIELEGEDFFYAFHYPEDGYLV